MARWVLYVIRIFLLVVGTPMILRAQQSPADTMPVPPANPKQLFYLQRTPNSNTIVVDLNTDAKGQLKEDDPVHVYWIRYQEHGQKAELSWIQRTFAYGMKVQQLSPERYELHFVSYKKYNMILARGADHQFHVFGMINGKAVYLNRIYIHINGGTFWSPHVEYVEVKGKDPGTSAEVRQRLRDVKKEE